MEAPKKHVTFLSITGSVTPHVVSRGYKGFLLAMLVSNVFDAIMQHWQRCETCG
jgi:hypothetical protein